MRDALAMIDARSNGNKDDGLLLNRDFDVVAAKNTSTGESTPPDQFADRMLADRHSTWSWQKILLIELVNVIVKDHSDSGTCIEASHQADAFANQVTVVAPQPLRIPPRGIAASHRESSAAWAAIVRAGVARSWRATKPRCADAACCSIGFA